MNGKLYPAHAHWHKDLPARESDEGLQAAPLDEINWCSDEALEIGREPMLVRGPILLFCLFLCGFLGFIIWLQLSHVGFSILLTSMLAIGVVFVVFGLRLDLSVPRQMPVRFSRVTGKIYWMTYALSANPFRRWRSYAKTWNWNETEAEIVKLAGFTGRIYVARYYLALADCGGGARAVKDREILVGPSSPAELEEAWGYLRSYMRGQQERLPPELTKDNSVHYIRSLFAYMPWIMLNEWGKAARREMFGRGNGRAVGNLLIVIVTFPFAPFFLLLGVANYIALKIAPIGEWPEHIDAESRGISIEEARAETSRELAKGGEKPRWSSVVAAVLTVMLLAWMVATLAG